MEAPEFKIKAIGTVENRIADPGHDCWDNVVSFIRILPEYRAGLFGLDEYSHVMVVYELSEAHFRLTNDLVKHPFEKKELPLAGVFARRAKERPNRLGVSTVRILNVNEDGVAVSGLDAVDGTWVLDLKAYDPVYDGVQVPQVPAWLSDNLGIYSSTSAGRDIRKNEQ